MNVQNPDGNIIKHKVDSINQVANHSKSFFGKKLYLAKAVDGSLITTTDSNKKMKMKEVISDINSLVDSIGDNRPQDKASLLSNLRGAVVNLTKRYKGNFISHFFKLLFSTEYKKNISDLTNLVNSTSYQNLEQLNLEATYKGEGDIEEDFPPQDGGPIFEQQRSLLEDPAILIKEMQEEIDEEDLNK